MLPCNNTANPQIRVIVSRMSDADELARRYFALWADYLTALISDPQAAELLQRWAAFTAQFARAAGERGGTPFAAWPPVPPADERSNGPTVDATTPAGASRQRDDAVGELTRRVDELERRLAASERNSKAARPRPRNRPSGG
jgi:hypothetical protein